MKSYSDYLWDKVQIVIKQSNDRRKQLEDFIYAISRRIQVQENYAKNIQGVGKLLQKYIKQKGTTSFTYSAFKSNSLHRAEQAKVFAQSLKDEVLLMLKQMLNNQNNECKKLEKDSRQFQKDMQNYLDNLSKSKTRFIAGDKQKQQQLISAQIAKISNQLTTDKKQKQIQKTKQIQKQVRQYESVYRFAVKEYNDFVEYYNSQMKKVLTKYQQHEADRIQKQVDTIMKILVFQTSMMRNFDYDITNISKQMESVKPETDIISFIEQNASDKPRPTFETVYSNGSLLNTTIYKIINKELDQKMQFQKNKEIKSFIESKYKNIEGKQIKQFKQQDIAQFQRVFNLVCSCWKSQDIGVKQLNTLKELIEKDNNRHLFLLSFRHFGSMSNLELPMKSYFTGGSMLEIVLQKCFQRKDIFVLRKLMNLLFSYWSSRQKQQIKTQIVEAQTPETSKQKILLYVKLMNNIIWKSNDYWEAAIFQSIHQQLKIAATKKGQTIQESLTREKNIILSQLASFCHNMIMLGITTKIVRQVVGKYCRLYDLSQQHNKDLSKTITNTYKQYKQLHGGKSIVSRQK